MVIADPDSGDRQASHDVALIDIVIVNWNAGTRLRCCLESIARHALAEVAGVVVVDNGSTDGSADNLDVPGLPLQIIRNADNPGFARACNQGAAIGQSAYVLFLNPDTEIFQGSLRTPLDYMMDPDHQDVGVCGIQLVDESDSVARTCSRLPSLRRLTIGALGLNKLPWLRSSGMAMRNWDHQSTRAVDQVMGAFFLTRRQVFDALQGFDERFFVYFEEVDFCCRAKRAGWEVMYLSNARAYHEGGGSSRQIKAGRLFYSLRSRLLYGFKHFPAWQAWTLVGVTAVIEPLTRLAFCLGRGGWSNAKDTLGGYRLFWKHLPDIVKSRSGHSR